MEQVMRCVGEMFDGGLLRHILVRAGRGEEILLDYEETCVRIPMAGDTRSLNLGNSVAIVLYEALRQYDFEELNLKGQLHRLKWRSGL